MIKIYDMLLRYCTLAIASVALLASCSSNEIDQIFKPKGNSFTIVARSSCPTRVALNDNSEQSRIVITWSAEDSFSLFDSAGTFVAHFIQSGEQGAESSKFISEDITSLTEGESYTAIYPYIEGDESRTLTERLDISIETMEQSENQSLDHLHSAMRMRSEFTYSQVAEPLAIQFTHDYAMLRLTFSLEGSHTPLKLRFTDNGTPYTLTYNYDTDYDNYISYLVFDPTEETSSHELNFCITTSGNEQQTYSTTIDKALVAGRCYTATIPNFTTQAMYTLANFSADSYPTDTDTWVITNSLATTTDFAGLSAAIAALNDSGRQISLEFPNLEVIPDYAIFGKSESDWEYPSAALVSVSADVATEVGRYAFYSCDALTSVELPIATEIGDYAFYSCYTLTYVKLPTVTAIGSNAFSNCDALTYVELPAATAIGYSAFSSCDALASVEIPAATWIGYYAFAYCNALTSLDIPSTVVSISGGAFNGCDNLATLNINTPNFIYEDGIVYNSDKTTIISALKAVVSGDYFSSIVTSIEDNTFINCDALTSVVIPSATEIGHDAFNNCDALTLVELPAATEIGRFAFYNCSALTSVKIPAATVIECNAFRSCDALTLVELATAENAVLNSIDSELFEYTTTTNITLTLGEANSEFVSGNTLTIGDFSAEFKKIILVEPDGDTTTPAEPFTGALADFSATSYPTDTDTWIITDATADATDFAGLSAAITALAESGRKIWLEFPNLQSFPGYAIYGISTVSSEFKSDALVSVSADVATLIDGYAFYGCKALERIDFPMVREIGNVALYDCDALTSIELPAAEIIGGSTFAWCDALTSIDLPVAKTIGDAAFQKCSLLTSVNIPTATTIGGRVFEGCHSLTMLDIPSTVTSIQGGAFNGCDKLTILNLNAQNYIYEDGVVYSSDKSEIISALSAVVDDNFCSATATLIDFYAFCECDNLTTVELPAARQLQNYSFGYCDALTSVVLATDEGIEISLGASAFDYTQTDNITLTLGSTNSKFVSDNTLTTEYFSKEFKEINFEDNTVAKSFSLLADFSATDYPTDTDTWVITDTTAESADFCGLREAMSSAGKEDRIITIEFSNLAELPESSLKMNGAFYGCTFATAVFPELTSIGGNSFSTCNELTSLTLATGENAIISSIASNAFSDTDTSQITLIVGAANNDYINGTKLEVGDVSITFKEIVVVNADGTLAEPVYDNLSEFSATTYPTDTDTWVINDVSAAYCSNFRGLGDALDAAYDTGHMISLEFPNLTAMPGGYTNTVYNSINFCDVIVSVSMPVATTIGEYAFFSCGSLTTLNAPCATYIGEHSFENSGLTSVDLPAAVEIADKAFRYTNITSAKLPSATTIGWYAFDSTNLTSLEVATKEGVVFEYIDTAAMTSEDITLTIGSASSALISDDCSLMIDDGREWLFERIIVVNSSGSVIAEYEQTYDVLSDYSSKLYPKDTDVWVVNDVDNSNFNGLQDALKSAYYKERKIEVILPNLNIGIPDGARNVVYGTCTGSLYNCDALTSIKMPLVTSIGDYTFYNCTALTSVAIPTATEVGISSFGFCETLSYIELATADNAVLSSVDCDAFYFTDTTNITLTLGEANSKFVSGNTLTVGSFSAEFLKIILVDANGNDVTPAEPPFTGTLADFSASSYPTDTDTWIITDTTADATDFAGLSEAITALAESGREISLEFPNLKGFPEYAIFGMSAVSSKFKSDALVSVSADVATLIDNYAFYACRALKRINFPMVRETINAFHNCEALTSVELPAAEIIGYDTFAWCNNLTSVVLPEATEIRTSAFQKCDALASVEIPKATMIEDYAFYNCDALTSLDIPSTVTAIGAGAFSNCHNLTTLNLNTPNFIYEDGVVYNSDKTSIISALNAVVSGDYFSSVVTSVEHYAFNGCYSLTSIELPEATMIGDNTFGDCTALTSVKLPAATEIGIGVFFFCQNLTAVEVATTDNAVLSSISDISFEDTTTTNITLTIGSANSGLVSGNTLTMDYFSEEFKEIIFK